MIWKLFIRRVGDYPAGTLVEYPTSIWAAMPKEHLEATIPVEQGRSGRLVLPEEILQPYLESVAGPPADRPANGRDDAMDLSSGIGTSPKRRPGRPRKHPEGQRT